MRPARISNLLEPALGWALTTALSLVSIHAPFGRDQGNTAYVAWIMDTGGVVYKDVFHFNLPAAFFTYLAAAKLLPLGIPECVNLLQVIVNALIFPLVYLIARRSSLSPRAASAAALLYGLFAALLYTDYWDIAQKESLAGLPLALALYAFLRLLPAVTSENLPETDTTASWKSIVIFATLAGAMTGLAAQFKPTLGIALAAGVLVAWQRRRPWPAGVSILAFTGAGFILSLVPLAVYIGKNHAAGPMYDFIFRFGGFYGGQQYGAGVGKAVVTAGWELGRWLYQWRALTALAVFGLAGRKLPAGQRLVAWFGALLLFQLVVQGKFFTYHFIPLLIPAGILAGAGASRLFESARASRLLTLALAALVLLVVTDNLAPEAGRVRRELLYDFGRIDRTTFLKPYGKWGEGDINPLATEAVAAYVKKNTRPGDAIQIMGHESALYLLAGRRAATRYYVDQPLMTDPAGNADFARFRDGIRAEFMAALAAKPPAYIIVIEDDATGIEPEDSYTQLGTFPELRDFIELDYALETKIEDFFLYRRMDRIHDQ